MHGSSLCHLAPGQRSRLNPSLPKSRKLQYLAIQPKPPPDSPKTNQPQHNESPPVKKLTILGLFVGWLTAASAVNAQSSGTIVGQVRNQATMMVLS